MRDGTLCLVTRDSPRPQILLGWKKYGFGQGKWGLPGGKIEPAESAQEAATRELEEETGLRANRESVAPMGLLDFRFPHQPVWSQTVYVFAVRSWLGELRESHEVLPRWYAWEEIPYRSMWSDGVHWLPQVLAGLPVRLRFEFGSDNDTVEQVTPLSGPRSERHLDPEQA